MLVARNCLHRAVINTFCSIMVYNLIYFKNLFQNLFFDLRNILKNANNEKASLFCG